MRRLHVLLMAFFPGDRVAGKLGPKELGPKELNPEELNPEKP